MVELASIASRVARRALNGTVTSEECPYDVVFAVGHEQVLLGRIMREGKVVGGPIAQCLRPQMNSITNLPSFVKI